MSKKEMTVKEFKHQYTLGALSNKDLKSIAENTQSEEIISALSTDENYYVRARVLLNDNTPEEIKNELRKIPLMFAFVLSALFDKAARRKNKRA